MMGGMGGRGGGMGMMMGGMGGMGGMMGGALRVRHERNVQVEMIGGQRIAGKVQLGPILVDTDVGQYAIDPEKVKSLRLLKPADEQPRQGDDGSTFYLIDGTVATTSNKEIRGHVHVPDWTLDVEDGSLRVLPLRMKAVAFAASPEKSAAEKTSAKGTDTTYSRLNDTIVMQSSGGDRVTFVDIGTKQKTSVRLSDSKNSRLNVVPIWGANVVALMVSGPKVTRIAAANSLTGVWHTQDLREPVTGSASPIVGSGVVAYGLGRYVYAYSAAAQRWGVAELPEGVLAVPIIGNNSVRVEIPGHIYTFDAQNAHWNHVDIGALLETTAGKDPDKSRD
jgi:hypothetical protein